MPGGHRWMYQLTGLPGWMRFGFSPGWIGRSPTGLGPCASFLMSGQWPTPQAQEYWQGVQQGQVPYPAFAPGAGFAGVPFAGGSAPGAWPGMTKEQELEFLKTQTDALEKQMDNIHARIKELSEEGS